MFKKTFIRLFFVALVMIAGLLVVGASGSKLVNACSEMVPGCKEEKTRAQNEFIILESLGKSIIGYTLY